MPSNLQPQAADILPGTPESVVVRMTPAPPKDDPTLGVPIQPLDPGLAALQPVNRLVTIGDSLTHGVQSGAIFNTKISWPMIVAWEMGWDDHMRVPRYDAHGGLPLNIEYVLRHLERSFGSSLGGLEYPLAAIKVRNLMAQIEDYWERGAGAEEPVTTAINHNLAMSGWDLRDALSRNYKNLHASIGTPKNDLFRQIVENAAERAALRVYPSQYPDHTVFDAARALGQQGAIAPNGEHVANAHGIDTLVVMLGANNALGAVTQLKVRWSKRGANDDYKDPERKRAFNVWDPVHFEEEYRVLVAQVDNIAARNVIFCTVPHVTIAPIARGVATKVRRGSRYFPYYTRPWISDAKFNPNDDPCLTAAEARAVDSAIDQYNEAIASLVKAGRENQKRYFLLDICGLLDRLACRRYIDDPAARPDWWTPYDLPGELRGLSPVPDSNFFRSGPQGRTHGGLFSLDGVHPTTIGYGVVAQEVIRVMQLAEVPFYYGDGKTRRTGNIAVDFDRLIELDTLISASPTCIDANLKLMGWLDQTIDWVLRLKPFLGSAGRRTGPMPASLGGVAGHPAHTN